MNNCMSLLPMLDGDVSLHKSTRMERDAAYMLARLRQLRYA